MSKAKIGYQIYSIMAIAGSNRPSSLMCCLFLQLHSTYVAELFSKFGLRTCVQQHQRQTERERERNPVFHVVENARMTVSKVPNTAMLTGTARTSVGARPRQKTRPPPPDSVYIFCAVRHDEPNPVSLSVPAIAPACKRVLRTSKGNVATQPMIPAAAPATSGAAQGRSEKRVSVSVSVSVSSTNESESRWYAGTGAVYTGVGEKRRSVPSYC